MKGLVTSLPIALGEALVRPVTRLGMMCGVRPVQETSFFISGVRGK
jgi:hypothetical protein